MTEALNALYESIKEDLLKETKETLIAEIHFETKQDQSIHTRIATITKEVFTHKKLETTMNTQLEEIKTHAQNQLEQHLARVLQPTEQMRNPYNPVDWALQHIQGEIKDMVTNAIAKIDEIIQGTVEQAVEDVRLSTRHDARQDPCPKAQTAAPRNQNTMNPFENP
jgi:hypothetical protein